MENLPQYKTINLDIQSKIANIRLNKPEESNALDNTTIGELLDCFAKIAEMPDLRVVILSSTGKYFCSGADLQWMKNVINYSYRQNLEESLQLAQLMFSIYTHPIPVIAKINGDAFGGGVGLISACDILISSDEARFGLTEVRIGLAPAVVSPFVISRIGQSLARELFITGEVFDAKKALEIGLINYAVPPKKLDNLVDEKVQLILNNGPNAVRTVKQLVYNIPQMKFPDVQDYTARLIADLRLSIEGQEGMNAMLDKRKPNWIE